MFCHCFHRMTADQTKLPTLWKRPTEAGTALAPLPGNAPSKRPLPRSLETAHRSWNAQSWKAHTQKLKGPQRKTSVSKTPANRGWKAFGVYKKTQRKTYTPKQRRLVYTKSNGKVHMFIYTKEDSIQRAHRGNFCGPTEETSVGQGWAFIGFRPLSKLTWEQIVVSTITIECNL